jgi:hypothetical protein
MEILAPVLTSLATMLPVILVEVALLVMAIVKAREMPKVSMYAGAAASLMLLVGIVSRVLSVAMPMQLRDSGKSVAQIGVTMSVIGITSSLLHALALALLVAAVFAERDGRKSTPQGY